MNKTMNDCGLPEKNILKIWSVLAQYAEVDKAILYGSRAKGNYRKDSDIDLTLEGDKLTDSIRGKINIDLDGLLLPYGIDLSIFEHLNHAKLRNHIERIGVVFYDKSTDKKKVGWKLVKLGDVCLVNRGTTITKKQTVEGNIPVIAGGIKPAYFHNQANRNAHIITVSGSGANAGFVNYWDTPIFASDCATIEPKDKTQDRKFILYYLLSQQQYIYNNFRSGTAQPHVYAKDIATLSYPITPINHQRQIVDKLDKIFAEIETAIVATQQKRIEIAKLKVATLSTCLSPNGNEWENVKLGDVVSYDKQSGQGADLPYVGMENIKPISMQLIGEIKIPLKISSTFIFNEQHVLFGRLRPYLQKVIVPTFEGKCSTEIFCLRPRKNIDRKYLAYWLLSPDISKAINATSTGARMPRANMKSILDFSFSFPSLEEQKRIVLKLDTVFAESDTMDNAAQVAEQNYIALKKSILADVFSKISDGI